MIFASRLLSVAFEGFLGCCLVVVPLGGLAVIIGVPRLLGLFPAAVGLSLGTASLAMLLTLWLVRLLGAARARSLVQVLTAILSGTLFLLSQLPNLLRGTDASLAAVLIRFQFLFARGAPLGSDSWLWFPARAIFFDPLSVLLTLVVSASLAWFTVGALHRTFVSGTQQTALVSQKPRKRPSVLRFRSGLSWVVLLKEWRIIRRNPYLLSRTFLQVLFVIPAVVLLLQDNRRLLFGYTGLVATIGAVAGGALAATLTSICVAGEQAPDLLKSSPNSSASLRRLKLLAALIPVWLLFLPLFLLLVVRGEPWFFALAIFGAATVSAAVLRLWNSRPVPLAELFQQRQRRGDIVLSLLEGFCWLGWGFLGFRAALGFGLESLAALVGLGFVIAVGYWRSRQLGSSLGF